MLLKWPAKDPANNRGERKRRIERATLLKQQPEQKNTNWASLEQKVEQGVLLL